MALALYLAVTAIIATLWSRFVQRISIGIAFALIAMPLVFTGRAILTNRVYAPIDLPYTAQPLHDYSHDFGTESPHDIAISDLHCQIIPWQKAVRSALAQGEWPLWNPHILNGDILAAAGQPAVYDPIQFLGFLIPLPDALTFGATMTFFLAAFFTFAFARASGLNEIASLVAAAGYTFCGMLAFFVGWPLGRAWAYLPLVLLGARRVVRERSMWMLVLAFVLTIFAGHPESVLHIVAVGAVYALSLRPSLRSIGLAIASGALALLLTAIYLLPFAEAAPQTLEYLIRHDLYAPTSYDVIVSPQTRHDRIVHTFIPFSAGPSTQAGWDPLSARAGVIVMLLALIAVFLRFRDAWFWLALAIVGLFATFGAKPIAHMLHALPLFDIAINERLAFAAAFAMSMLAALTVDRIPKRGFALALLALILAERVNEDGVFYPALPKSVFYPRIPVIAAIPRDARMAGLGTTLIPNGAALYGLEDARGYEAMTFRRLYETYPLWSQYQRAWFNRIDDLSRPFLSFLNVCTALAPADAGVPEGWTVRMRDRETNLLENTRVLPRANVPNRVRYVKTNPVEDMKTATNFADVAWIETDAYEPHEAANGPGRVTLHRHGLGYTLDATMDQPGWITIAETAWPGWRAYIDGRRVQTHFANHAFLGVHVPAGHHEVRLTYLPQTFVQGRAISLVTLMVWTAATLVAALARSRRAAAQPPPLSDSESQRPS